MSNSKTVLVLGALGGVGNSVARAFQDKGWRVLGLVRPGREAQLPAGMLPVTADLFDARAVAAAAGPVDIVFNGINIPYPQWPTHLLPTFTAAADVAEVLGARHIYPGSVYNFGANMPAQLTPQTPFAATTVKGRLRVAIEDMLRQRADAGSLRTIVVRAGDFIGDGAKNSWMSTLVAKDLKAGKITSPGGYDTVHAWAYLPDLAKVVVALAEREALLCDYEVFHFDSHNVTMRELAAAGSAGIGRKVKLTHLPRFVFSALGLFNPFMKATIEMLYLWDVPHALRDDRLAEVIGNVPRTSLGDIMKTLI